MRRLAPRSSDRTIGSIWEQLETTKAPQGAFLFSGLLPRPYPSRYGDIDDALLLIVQ